MSTSPSDFNAQVVEEFRANDGRVASIPDSMHLLLLHHTGTKSGTKHISPLAYLIDDGRYVIFASNMASPTNPAWYHNLKAHPQATVEVGPATIDVIANEATGEERERLYRTQAERVSNYADFAKQTERIIPVVVLTPAPAG